MKKDAVKTGTPKTRSIPDFVPGKVVVDLDKVVAVVDLDTAAAVVVVDSSIRAVVNDLCHWEKTSPLEGSCCLLVLTGPHYLEIRKISHNDAK